MSAPTALAVAGLGGMAFVLLVLSAAMLVNFLAAATRPERPGVFPMLVWVCVLAAAVGVWFGLLAANVAGWLEIT